MAVGRDALESDVVFFESFLELVGTFVIKDVKLWGKTVRLEFSV
jgi:hypothetical protein